MKSTFHSMRPQFEEDYLSIEKQYIEEGWGIYDDSPDLHRAIAWSDAYYGDGSSVVTLYRVTGNSILLQNITDKLYAPYWFYDVIDIPEKNQFLIKPPETEAVFIFNRRTGELCQEIPLARNLFSNRGLGYWNHVMAKRIGSQVIIYPYQSNVWYMYDINKDELSEISCGSQKKHFLLIGSIEYRSDLYFWNSSAQFWRYDTKRLKVEEIGDWSNFNKSLNKNILLDAGCVLAKMLYIPLGQNGNVMKFDLEQRVACIISIGNECDRYINVTTDGQHLWLVKDIPEIDCYDVESGKLINYKLIMGKKEEIFPYFVYITYTSKNKILAFPCCEYENATEIMSISLDSRKIEQVAQYKFGYGMVRRIQDDYIVAIDVCHNIIDTYDDNGNLTYRCHVDIGKEMKKKWLNNCFDLKGKIATEKCNINLLDFLERVRKEGGAEIKDRKAVGKRIYQLMGGIG